MHRCGMQVGVLLILSPTLMDSPTRPPAVTALLVGWGLVGGVTLLAEAWRRYAKLRAAPEMTAVETDR